MLQQKASGESKDAPVLDSMHVSDIVSDIKMTTRTFARNLAKAKRIASSGKAVEVSDAGTGRVFIFSLKPRDSWRFPEDVMGMMEGPEDLSQRKGLSG